MRETETEEELLEVRALEIKGLGIAVFVCWREPSNNDEKGDGRGNHSAISTRSQNPDTTLYCNRRVYAVGEMNDGSPAQKNHRSPIFLGWIFWVDPFQAQHFNFSNCFCIG